ncbi:hypothetical protein ACSSV4_002066 [Roseovarius sp. MBR-154]
MLESYLTIATHPLLWIFIGLTVVFYGVQRVVGQSAEAPTAPDDRIRRLAETVGMKGLHPVLFLILLLTWGIVAGTLFAGLYAILWQVIFHAPPEGAEDVWNWRFTLAQLVALTTVLGAVIALPITINRLILTRRQTDTVEQGHITDRINKAVEGLGHAEPSVRMGAILTFNRIMDDSPSDRVMVLQMLNAYIEYHQPAVTGEVDTPVQDTSIDVQAALDVLLKWQR